MPDKYYTNQENELETKDKDAELVVKIENLYKEAKEKKRTQEKYYKSNKKYYLGDHWSMKRPTYKSSIVDNRVFTAVEQIVPMMTDRQPKLSVERKKLYGEPNRDEEADMQAKVCEKMLEYHWDRLKMSLITPQIIRHMYLYRDCILHWFWNYWEDDVDVEIMNPYHFFIDPKATSLDDAEYVIKCVPRSIKQIMDMKNEGVYKNITKEELRTYTGSDVYDESEDNEEDEHNDRDNLIDVKEFWGYVENGDKYELKVITVIAGKVVRNEKDPNFDYGTDDINIEQQETSVGAEGVVSEVAQPIEQQLDEQGLPIPQEQSLEGMPEQQMGMEQGMEGQMPEQGMEQPQEEPKSFNHFRRPKLPFIIISSYQTGEDVFSITSSIEQSAPLQKDINKRKAQISDNADLINNSVWLIDQESGIESWQLKKNKPNLIVKGNNVSPEHIRRDRPPGLPEFIFKDLEHSEREFDNVFGMHDISRGLQIGTKSATEAQLLKESDQGRPALMTRLFESGIQDLGNAWLQLMKVNYTEEHYGRSLTADEADKYFALTRDNIPDDVEVKVLVGSTLPIDRVTRRQESLDMFFKGAIAPPTLYKRLEDIDKPEETAKELQGWARGMQLPGDPPMPQPGQEEVPEGQGQDVSDLPRTLNSMDRNDILAELQIQ